MKVGDQTTGICACGKQVACNFNQMKFKCSECYRNWCYSQGK